MGTCLLVGFLTACPVAGRTSGRRVPSSTDHRPWTIPPNGYRNRLCRANKRSPLNRPRISMLAEAVGDRQTTVAAEGPSGHFDARWCLAPLVLAAIHQTDDLLDERRVVAQRDDLVIAAV